MKIEHIQIQNFRSISDLSLSFRDEFGLIRDRVPIVGPNTTGKTTILDGIALSLMPVTELWRLRDSIRIAPSSIVRRGAVHASVTSSVWFSDQEIEATREVMERAGSPYGRPVPQTNRVTVHWTYPDPQGHHPLGYYRCDPVDGWLLFRGRKTLLMYRHSPQLSARGFRNLGQVVLFDQQRTGLATKLHPRERGLLGQVIGLDPLAETDGFSNGTENGTANSDAATSNYPVLTSDPREILTSLAMRAQVRQDAGASEREDFDRLCQLYERVCRPHKINGLYNTDHGLDMEFIGDQGVYFFDGLSSGQQMILLLLLQFAIRRIHRSIVLIDEIELHLHPLWQDRLYSSLSDLGDDNQVIFTTHSTHLRDTLNEPFHSTGDLVSIH